MASIIQRGDKWRALIRRAGHQSICRTFPTKAAAERWARGIETQMDEGREVEAERLTVGDLIRTYRKLRDQSRPIADDSTEHYTLKMLERLLGGEDARKIGTDELLAFAAQRRDEGAGAYTINMDVSKLSTVMRYAASAKKLTLPDPVGSARPLLTHLGLIGGGGKRDRRPTQDEMERIDAHLRAGRGAVYAEAVLFASVTAMRRGEVCALRRADIDPATHLIPVWRKHPRKGKVLETVPLLAPAMVIVARQPVSNDGRIFPIEPGTLSKYFTEACRALAIPDLHLHDMRHEGTSRLFEEGFDIPRVALVTGHKKWENLKRYTNLKPGDLTKVKPLSPELRQSTPPRPDGLPSAGRRPRRFSQGKSPR